jgi:hypothetical protein
LITVITVRPLLASIESVGRWCRHELVQPLDGPRDVDDRRGGGERTGKRWPLCAAVLPLDGAVFPATAAAADRVPALEPTLRSPRSPAHVVNLEPKVPM